MAVLSLVVASVALAGFTPPTSTQAGIATRLTDFVRRRLAAGVKLLGVVAGGGLGQAIGDNVQLSFYPRLNTLIVLIYALVLTSGWIGERLRLSVA